MTSAPVQPPAPRRDQRRLALLAASLWLAGCVVLGILRAAVELRAVSKLWDVLSGLR